MTSITEKTVRDLQNFRSSLENDYLGPPNIKIKYIAPYVDQHSLKWIKQCKENYLNLPRRVAEKDAVRMLNESIQEAIKYYVKQETKENPETIYHAWVAAAKPHVFQGGSGHCVSTAVWDAHNAQIPEEQYNDATRCTLIRALAAFSLGQDIVVYPISTVARWGN